MAYEREIFDIGALTAAADLSAKQYFCVKKNATDNQVALCDADGEVFLGILQDKPDSGIAAKVRCMGVSKVTAGEALTAGDFWGTDSSGKAKKIEGTVTGADVGDYVMGVVLEGAASGALATVSVGVPTYRVEAQ